MSSNETTLKCKPKRYLWVDNLKMFACLLVVIGHLYMSMMAGGWIRENNILYCWPIQTVYTFHVPLFFVCSGFLYQATAPNEWNVKKHIGNIKKKSPRIGCSVCNVFNYYTFTKECICHGCKQRRTTFFENASYRTNRSILVFVYAFFVVLPDSSGDRKRKKKNAGQHGCHSVLHEDHLCGVACR